MRDAFLGGVYSAGSNGICYDHSRSPFTSTSGVQVYTPPKLLMAIWTETVQEELSQIPLVSCNNKHSHSLNTAERAVEVVKERIKKRAKEETTPTH